MYKIKRDCEGPSLAIALLCVLRSTYLIIYVLCVLIILKIVYHVLHMNF